MLYAENRNKTALIYFFAIFGVMLLLSAFALTSLIPKVPHYNFQIDVYDGETLLRSVKCWTYSDEVIIRDGKILKITRCYLEHKIEIEPYIVRELLGQTVEVYLTENSCLSNKHAKEKL